MAAHTFKRARSPAPTGARRSSIIAARFTLQAGRRATPTAASDSSFRRGRALTLRPPPMRSAGSTAAAICAVDAISRGLAALPGFPAELTPQPAWPSRSAWPRPLRCSQFCELIGGDAVRRVQADSPAGCGSSRDFSAHLPHRPGV